jgi:hypothetical protein
VGGTRYVDEPIGDGEAGPNVTVEVPLPI